MNSATFAVKISHCKRIYSITHMNFFSRYASFFLFVVLELYALSLVARYNTVQGEIYQSSANLFTGVIYENFSSINKYFAVQELADSLARENAQLKTQLESSKYVVAAERGLVKLPLDTSTIRPDTAPKKDVMQQFQYQSAEVINNSVARQENYLTLNRGSLHGVRAGMGVVSSDGIVGIVRNVTPRFCQVMSVLNKRMSVSGMIRRNRYFGSLVWHGGNPKMLTLESVPKHAEIMKGDTVMTSGFSDIFPGGYYIGRVTNFSIKDGSNFYTIDVETWNDIAKVRYVYIVENLLLSEMQAFFK
jgi:rod shape-determining protein MreC